LKLLEVPKNEKITVPMPKTCLMKKTSQVGQRDSKGKP